MNRSLKLGVYGPYRVRGWTLIEVLISIAVLAILVALGLMMYRNGVHTSRVGKATRGSSRPSITR